MRIRNDSVAIPWEFSQEEADTIKGMLEVPLMQAYLQSVKHQALSNLLVDPTTATEQDLVASNAYMAGQEFLLDALMSEDLYIKAYKE